MRMIRKPAFFAGACIAAALIAACSDTPTSATQASIKGTRASFAAGAIPAGSLEIQKVKVCKDISSPANPADGSGRYSFNVSSGGTVLVAPGQCVTVLTVTVPTPAGVTVSENSTSALVKFDSVAFDKIDAAGANTIGVSTSNSQTGYANQFHGSVFNYYNSSVPQGGCTLTIGFWKTHGPIPTGNNSNEWPVTNLTLGTVNYTASQLLSILNTPPKGNGLITLAHQLIGAKLNIANGASDASIAATIAAADALIGNKVIPPIGSGWLDPSAVSALVTALTNFNEGTTGPGHCS